MIFFDDDYTFVVSTICVKKIPKMYKKNFLQLFPSWYFFSHPTLAAIFEIYSDFMKTLTSTAHFVVSK